MAADNLPVDRGWAWVILFAVTTTQFLYVGTLKSFGIFFVEILEEFKESVSVTSLISGIQSGMYCIVSLPLLLCGINKFGVRKAIIAGSLLISVGYAISAFSPNIDFLYFSISIVVGSGSAFLYAPSLVILGQYFDKRRGVATGIAISGGCLGSLVLPPFYRFLLDIYGLRGALLITSGLLFNNTAMACLLRPFEFYNRKKTATISEPPRISKYINGDGIKNGTIKSVSTDQMDKENQINGIKHKSNITLLNGEHISGSHPVISKSSPLTARAEIKKGKRFRTFSEADDSIGESHTDIMSSKLSLSSFYKYISLDDVATMSILSIKELKTDEMELDEEFEESHKPKCFNLNFAIFKNPSYVLFVFVHLLGSIAPVMTSSFLPVYLKENGLTNDKIVILVSVLGAADFIGRILSGYFADKPWIRTYQIILVTQGVAGIVINCSSLCSTFWELVIFSALVGISAGGIFAVLVPVVADIIGMEQFTSGFAFLIITQGPFLAISAPIFGLLRDHTGSYDASFHFLGTTSLMASVLLCFEPLIERCRQKENAKDSDIIVEEIESLTQNTKQ